MPLAAYRSRPRNPRHEACTDHVVGAILSGWRYDISEIPADLRGDYEAHLQECPHCCNRQRLHRTVDILLLTVTTLSVAAFVLATLVMHRLEAYTRVTNVHLKLHGATSVATHIPASISVSLEAVAVSGVFISVLLCLLVAMATPVSGMLLARVRERLSGEDRDRLKHAA